MQKLEFSLKFGGLGRTWAFENMNILECFDLDISFSSRRFQRALRDCCDINVTQDMAKNVLNVFLAKIQETGDLVRNPRKFENLGIFPFFYASNESSTTSSTCFYGVVFDFHRSDRGSDPGRGGKIS